MCQAVRGRALASGFNVPMQTQFICLSGIPHPTNQGDRSCSANVSIVGKCDRGWRREGAIGFEEEGDRGFKGRAIVGKKGKGRSPVV
jgi:hypothetical protein